MNGSVLAPAAAAPPAPPTLRRVVFISQTTATDEQQAIVHRLSQAANAAGGITGLLVYGDGRFLQYLEGHAPAVEGVLAGVRADPLHGRLAVLLDEPAPERLFAASGGGRLAVDSASWRRLVEADWPTLGRLRRDSPDGLAVLVDLARDPMGGAEQEDRSDQAERERLLPRRAPVDRAMGRVERTFWAAGAALLAVALVAVARL